MWFFCFVGFSMLLLLCFIVWFFFFKQKTAYEMRISDWSSDVCSSDLFDGYEGERFEVLGEQPAQRGAVLVENQIVGSDGEPVAINYQIGRASCRERVCQYV